MSLKEVLVIGGTGLQGSKIVRTLKATGKFKVRFLTRNHESAKAQELIALNVEAFKGEVYNEKDILFAMKVTNDRNVDIVVMILNPRQLRNKFEDEVKCGRLIADLAEKAGVKQFIYSSAISADLASDVPLFVSKKQIEQHLLGKKFPNLTILRPAYFMDNLLSMIPKLMKGVLRLPLKPDHKLPMIAVDDIAKLTAYVCQRPDELNRKIIEVAGDIKTAEEYAKALRCFFEEQPLHEIEDDDLRKMWSFFQTQKFHEYNIEFLKKIIPDIMDISAFARKYGLVPAAH